MRDVMEVGVPEMNIPVLEPVFLGLIDFKFYNLNVQFIDVTMKGLKSFKLLDSHLNKTSGYDHLKPMNMDVSFQLNFTIPTACGESRQCCRKCQPQDHTNYSGLFLCSCFLWTWATQLVTKGDRMKLSSSVGKLHKLGLQLIRSLLMRP